MTNMDSSSDWIRNTTNPITTIHYDTNNNLLVDFERQIFQESYLMMTNSKIDWFNVWINIKKNVVKYLLAKSKHANEVCHYNHAINKLKPKPLLLANK